jgi:methionine sulfoxide reductase heme-binding subunit
MRGLGHRAAKPAVFSACLLPLGCLVVAAFTDRLGANPAEALVRSLGDWTLRALLLVLAITPMRVMLGAPTLARFRRMLGLFVFFYATLHWLAYAWFDMGFVWADVWADVPRRPFILVGTLAWLVLLSLAITSSNRVIRRMGAARWQRLHRGVYAVVVLALLHFFWMRAGKNDFFEVTIYAVLFAVLLGWRVWRKWRSRMH